MWSCDESDLSDDGLRCHDHLVAVNVHKVQLPLPQQAEHQRLQTLLTRTHTHILAALGLYLVYIFPKIGINQHRKFKLN